MDEGSGKPVEEIDRQFIISARSQKLTIRTGQPPEPASNLGILASTCHSMQIGWDPPRERGVEVKCKSLIIYQILDYMSYCLMTFLILYFAVVRVDCVPTNMSIKGHICLELLPSETVANLQNLCENTEYDVIVTAVTEEYFDTLPVGHEWRKERRIPYDLKKIPDSEWLPRSILPVCYSYSFILYSC